MLNIIDELVHITELGTSKRLWIEESYLRDCVAEFNKYKGTLDDSHKWDKSKDNLYQHALRELKIAGLFDGDADYGGALAKAVLEIVEAFCKQGHSGGSASIVLQIMPKLLSWENLTPITDNADDWIAITEEMRDKDNLWQCRRNPLLFSSDGGKTYYSVNDRSRKIHNSEPMKESYEINCPKCGGHVGNSNDDIFSPEYATVHCPHCGEEFRNPRKG